MKVYVLEEMCSCGCGCAWIELGIFSSDELARQKWLDYDSRPDAWDLRVREVEVIEVIGPSLGNQPRCEGCHGIR